MNEASMGRRSRYPSFAIGLHWLTLLLLIAVYTLIELHEHFPKGSVVRETLKSGHFTMGLTVWLVTLVRVALRGRFRMAEIRPAPPKWQRLAADGVHWLLYLFLLGMPLLGWFTLSAKGDVIPFYGLDLPALLSANKPFGEELETIHKAIGHFGYYLIGLHAAAALFHHYWLRDDALLRMLPRRGRLRREHTA